MQLQNANSNTNTKYLHKDKHNHKRIHLTQARAAYARKEADVLATRRALDVMRSEMEEMSLRLEAARESENASTQQRVMLAVAEVTPFDGFFIFFRSPFFLNDYLELARAFFFFD